MGGVQQRNDIIQWTIQYYIINDESWFYGFQHNQIAIFIVGESKEFHL